MPERIAHATQQFDNLSTALAVAARRSSYAPLPLYMRTVADRQAPLCRHQAGYGVVAHATR